MLFEEYLRKHQRQNTGVTLPENQSDIDVPLQDDAVPPTACGGDRSDSEEEPSTGMEPALLSDHDGEVEERMEIKEEIEDGERGSCDVSDVRPCGTVVGKKSLRRKRGRHFALVKKLKVTGHNVEPLNIVQDLIKNPKTSLQRSTNVSFVLLYTQLLIHSNLNKKAE